MGRYLSIWLPQPVVDRAVQLRPELKDVPFVLATPLRGRMVVQSASVAAMQQGIKPGMVVADARAVLPALQVYPEKEGRQQQLLTRLALWCLRYTPVAAIDPDGLLLDISGCAHLWGGEQAYLQDIMNRLRAEGYTVKAAIAGTIGAAWAVARYGSGFEIVPPGGQLDALLAFPPAALRLETGILERMFKLGLYKTGNFVNMPRTVLRRRFGQQLLQRIDQALGQAIETLTPVLPPMHFRERLPCLDPIRTRTGIDIALRKLLEQLCLKLLQEGKGLRSAVFKGYRIDGITEQVEIGTSRAVRHVAHLYRLFEQKIATITPALGIELFVLEAPVFEPLSVQQEALWQMLGGDAGTELSQLIDRLEGRLGAAAIHRYLPAEHYWPERSLKPAAALADKPDTPWRTDRPRPLYLLPRPERVEVSVPIPDYPPLLFIYNGTIHKIKKADGPERIEREWWLEQGLVRDYYYVEDEQGARYWLFRSGQYEAHTPEWFIHGFFA